LSEAGQLVQSLISVYQKAGTNPIPSVEDESAIYVLRLAANVSEWESLTAYLDFLTQTPEPVLIPCGWVVRCASEDSGDDIDLNDEEEGENLCNCQFSLAYSAKILLNIGTLHFKHEHR
jgi:elongation factor 3